MAETVQFDFLHAFIEKALDDAGMEHLTEETRAQYVPQFAAEAEKRIGIALMPKLHTAAADDLDQLMKDPAMLTPERMQAFWEKHVPDYAQIVQETLAGFAIELKNTLAQIA